MELAECLKKMKRQREQSSTTSTKRARARAPSLLTSLPDITHICRLLSHAADETHLREAFNQSRSPSLLSISNKAQGTNIVCNCNTLTEHHIFKNFLTACKHYKFPGSHQVGSYGPKGTGIVRTYSNSTPGKDIVLNQGNLFLYRLKDEKVRAQFNINAQQKKPVQIFRKISTGVIDLGLFYVNGYIAAGINDESDKYGKEFVQFVSICVLYNSNYTSAALTICS